MKGTCSLFFCCFFFYFRAVFVGQQMIFLLLYLMLIKPNKKIKSTTRYMHIVTTVKMIQLTNNVNEKGSSTHQV